MRTTDTQTGPDDAGFGLIELIVAMTVITLMLMALAPFLISSFEATARNVRTAGATDLVNQRIALGQSREFSVSCTTFETFVNKYVGTSDLGNIVKDEQREITYEISMGTNFKIGECNSAVAAGTPESYYISVEVANQQDSKVLGRAKTWIAVPGFGA